MIEGLAGVGFGGAFALIAERERSDMRCCFELASTGREQVFA